MSVARGLERQQTRQKSLINFLATFYLRHRCHSFSHSAVISCRWQIVETNYGTRTQIEKFVDNCVFACGQLLSSFHFLLCFSCTAPTDTNKLLSSFEWNSLKSIRVTVRLHTFEASALMFTASLARIDTYCVSAYREIWNGKWCWLSIQCFRIYVCVCVYNLIAIVKVLNVFEYENFQMNKIEYLDP